MKKLVAVLMIVGTTAVPAFADGNAKAGKKTFKKWKACHTVKADKNKVAPTLYKVVGASPGKADGFKHPSALSSDILIWDAGTLSAPLAKPKDVVPGTKVVFSDLRKPDQIEDVIAYLVAEGEK